jgi:uracil-DNA glycosylase
MEYFVNLIKSTIKTNFKDILLDQENIKNYKLDKLYEKIGTLLQEKRGKYLPKENKIFDAFNYFDIQNTKVVLIGQDPYPGYHIDKIGNKVPYACGLAFSYTKGIPKPKYSLKNIFKELEYEYNVLRTNTNLEDWAKQGVLLINTSLTVLPHKPNSHAKKGWEEIIDFIISSTSYFAPYAVYLLLGKSAQSKADIIFKRNSKAHIVMAGHPSPINRYGTFLKSQCFTLVNVYLKNNKLPEIKWV